MLSNIVFPVVNSQNVFKHRTLRNDHRELSKFTVVVNVHVFTQNEIRNYFSYYKNCNCIEVLLSCLFYFTVAEDIVPILSHEDLSGEGRSISDIDQFSEDTEEIEDIDQFADDTEDHVKFL